MLAPIVLFVYNRPEHARKTLESLEKNDLAKESDLFIFADGPKNGITEEQIEKIKEVREIIREKKWCANIHITEREKHLGLAGSIIAGVTEIVNKFGKIIVLEDDLLLSKNFLKYMNAALNKFENEERVMQISGYMFPVEISAENNVFLLPFTNSWGWATWKRVWDNFDESASGTKILDENSELRKKFDLNDSYPYYKMLKKQQAGEVDSWAIRFYLSVFLKNGSTLYPRKTLVNNIGFDGSGIHCRLKIKQMDIANDFVAENFDNLEMDPKIQNKIFKFFKKQKNVLVRIYYTLID
jgi:hypothetical protein